MLFHFSLLRHHQTITIYSEETKHGGDDEGYEGKTGLSTWEKLLSGVYVRKIKEAFSYLSHPKDNVTFGTEQAVPLITSATVTGRVGKKDGSEMFWAVNKRTWKQSRNLYDNRHG
ncbi:hypothetical protein CEXT_290871 [Caerostris extrusa]|uniref:Uncharacterized protein n=1 Tax=Caerostris extrusa TaxID=172846 RepID=A0AAV4U5C6_CAEEX|nr:hypothetical protein CEXT_290871 [Caerostris extrusa]